MNRKTPHGDRETGREPVPEPRPMPPTRLSWVKRTVVPMLVWAAASSAAGCSLLPKEEAPLQPPLVKPAQAEVRTIEAKTGSIVRQVAGSAAFVPTRVTYHELGADGVVEAVHVRSGDEVKRGDALVTLRSDGLDVELLQRELEYEKKKMAFEDAAREGDERRTRIARLELELAELLYRKAKEKAEQSVLRAEADGLVTYTADLLPGDWAEANRVMVAVADPSGMRLALQAGSNPALADIKVGMTAEITFKGKAYTGIVTQTPASAPPTEDDRLREEYGRTIYIEMDELPEGATFGALADVRIVAARRDNVIVLPKSAVRSYFGRTYVQVLDGERRREIDVETGLETGTETEIVRGVEEGMKIILP